MPKRRAQRCVFTEGGRRCPFDGTGSPSLCGPHLITMQAAAKPKTPLDIAAEAFENLLNGRPINARETLGAAEAFFGGFSSIPHPASWQDHLRNRMRGSADKPLESQAPPPPRQPTDDEVRAAAAAKARRVLGFPPAMKLTLPVVKARRRELAKKYHPDVTGGSAKKMALVNDSADVLEATLS